MTTMKSACTVYYGPSSSGYPSVGRVAAGESVDFLWMEGSWCYITYAVDGTNSRKGGYVTNENINYYNVAPQVFNDNNSGSMRLPHTVYVKLRDSYIQISGNWLDLWKPGFGQNCHC